MNSITVFLVGKWKRGHELLTCQYHGAGSRWVHVVFEAKYIRSEETWIWLGSDRGRNKCLHHWSIVASENTVASQCKLEEERGKKNMELHPVYDEDTNLHVSVYGCAPCRYNHCMHFLWTSWQVLDTYNGTSWLRCFSLHQDCYFASS